MTQDEKEAVISAANLASGIEVLIGWAADAARTESETAVRAIEGLAGELRFRLQRIADA